MAIVRTAYIVVEVFNDGTLDEHCFGPGCNPAEAILSAANNTGQTTEEMESAIESGYYRVLGATDAFLLVIEETISGRIEWCVVDGIACTPEEAWADITTYSFNVRPGAVIAI